MKTIESDLAIALSDKLERDNRTADSQIEVIDENGVVTLSGIALSNEARSAAAEIAINHPAVLSIINDIVVDPDATSEVNIVAPIPIDPAFRRQ
jgi:osmotically-inducible protein OsmY